MNRRLADEVWQAAIKESDESLAKIEGLDGLERFIEAQESEVENRLAFAKIREGHRKKILWANSNGKREKWSIVYLHGFSAGPLELEPTISNLSKKLNANLYLSRLSAHGLTDGESFATVKAADWVKDVADSVAIGKRLGENVLLVGTSTGAALALKFAEVAGANVEVAGANVEVAGANSDGSASQSDNSIRAMILLSPNYKVSAFGAEILGNQFGPLLADVLVGQYREFAPENERHGSRWTTKYRSEALHELILVTVSARQVAVEELKIPVLTVYTERDEVVSVSEIEKRAGKFRHPKSLTVDWPEGQRHQLASETFHPEKIESLVGLLSDWFSKLEIGSREN